MYMCMYVYMYVHMYVHMYYVGMWGKLPGPGFLTGLAFCFGHSDVSGVISARVWFDVFLVTAAAAQHK